MSAQSEIAAKVLATPKPLDDTSTLSVPNTKENTVKDLPEELQLFLAQQDEQLDDGLDILAHLSQGGIVLCIVQSMTTDVEMKKYGEGAIYLNAQNGNTIIAGKADEQTSTRVPFVPLFVYEDFRVHNPYMGQESKGKSMFRAITTDPASDIAHRARSFDDSIKFAPYPEDPTNPKKRIEYVNHINVLCKLVGYPDWEDATVHFSFNRGSYKNGIAFRDLLALGNVPYYYRVFDLYTKLTHHTSGYNSYIPVVENSTFQQYVTGKHIEDNTKLFKKYKEMYLKGLFCADIQPLTIGSSNGQPAITTTSTPVAPPKQLTTEEQAQSVF